MPVVASSGDTFSGVAAALTGLPHFAQNFAPGFKTAPQVGQTAEETAGSGAAEGRGLESTSL